ncbi:hypothetical protein B0T24DRAFT_602460 [Lasiosphaeria ovina]|uniref:Uncharacterized protein n=1 Tax=Lasiosphaeria ovina TaxID=92902 RepID=A0AAE0NJM1_9PEZI|nr:hypothetical protein B0T24DRAFT_602460 [Lasiosphaeria ovina]
MDAFLPSTPRGPSHSAVSEGTPRNPFRQGIDLGYFFLGQWLRTESHSEVYTVIDTMRDRTQECSNHEARVFVIDPKWVHPKVRCHRLRCIKRLASRVVLEAGTATYRIVVYRKGDIEKPRDLGDEPSEIQASVVALVAKGLDNTMEVSVGDDNPTAIDDGEKDQGAPMPKQHPPRKSPYQQESKKARQRDRRQAARQAKRQQPKSDPSNGDNDTTAKLDESGDTENFWMVVLLYLAYDETGQLRDDIPENSSQALQGTNGTGTVLPGYMQKYLSRQKLNFTSAAHMQEYMAVKQSEIIFLKRQLSQMPGIDQYYKDQCLVAMREQQARHAPGSRQWKETQQGVTRFTKHRLTTVRHVTKALPGVIQNAEKTLRELKLKLERVRQRQEERSSVEALRGEREKLQEKMRTVVTWQHNVIPLSTTFGELAGRWEALARQLKSTEQALESFVLESESDVEEDLLTVNVR